MRTRWLVAAVLIILLAVALRAFFPGTDETMGDSQPGPLPQSPAPAPQ